MILKPIRDYASYSAPLAREIFRILHAELLAPIEAIMSNAAPRENKNMLAHGTPNLDFQGIKIFIENPAGSYRHGKKWTQLMANDYGYVCGTEAIDGDELDCFVGPHRASRKMFIVEQKVPETGEFDEYKVMFGFNEINEATSAYFANYQAGWKGFGHIHQYPLAFFKRWYMSTLQREITNAIGDNVVSALKAGRLQYVGEYFIGKLNSSLSKDLRALGATYNKVRKAYRLEVGRLPQNIRQAIAMANYQAKDKIKQVNDILDAMQSRELTGRDLEPFFGDTLHRLEKQFYITTKPITSADLEVPMRPQLVEQIKEAYTENLNLYIKKWRDEQILRLRLKVNKNVSEGFRAERLMQDIMRERSMTKNHARFLAKQETSLMTASYREVKYKEIGVNEYIWSTSMDERVRPYPWLRGKARANDHRILQGRKFRFDHPPVVDSIRGRRANPGQDYGCRCVAIPYITDGINFIKPEPEMATA